ncbi:MAG: hypothetical protein L0387_30620 [Acidobacteria bacterium]|nr:hypothetical protein [Acidobacteriota bacterium]MCI0721551.1 hypothetical protein [Acidobacteriota bacterium]
MLNKLVGKVDACRPSYYVVTYEELAEVVVPLKFQKVSSGRRLYHPRRLGDIYFVMLGVSPREDWLGDPDKPTDAMVIRRAKFVPLAKWPMAIYS